MRVSVAGLARCALGQLEGRVWWRGGEAARARSVKFGRLELLNVREPLAAGSLLSSGPVVAISDQGAEPVVLGEKRTTSKAVEEALSRRHRIDVSLRGLVHHLNLLRIATCLY